MILAMEDVAFAYDPKGFCLRVPALSLEEGERLAIIGPSGSGKSTLLNLIAGILRPDRGRIFLAGTEITSLIDGKRRRFRAEHIGFVLQDFALLDFLTVRQNILYPYRICEGLRLDACARGRAAELSEACGLAGKLDHYPSVLSQGEKQRVALCRALVTCPKLVLADEATGNLDPRNKMRSLDLLFERSEQSGASVLAVTHDHALLPGFDRVLDFAECQGSVDG